MNKKDKQDRQADRQTGRRTDGQKDNSFITFVLYAQEVGNALYDASKNCDGSKNDDEGKTSWCSELRKMIVEP